MMRWGLNEMAEYESLEAGLIDLCSMMKADPLTWSDELQTIYYGRQGAIESLTILLSDCSVAHNAWANLITPMEMMPQFDNIHWFISYQELSAYYNRPMSWFHSLSLQVITDPMYRTWKVRKEPQLLDDEGYLVEMCYAAYLDGVTDGLLEPSEGIEELRHPQHIKITNEVLEMLEMQAHQLDLTLDEAKSMLSSVYDMTPA
jgi:hypothetical protein